MTRFILPMIAFALLVLVLQSGLTLNPNELPSPLLQQPAPQFELPSLADPQALVGSATYEDQMVLVNVWATWCPGCRQEHEFLNSLAQSEAIPIFGLNWRDNRPEALRWLEALGDPYMATAFDRDGRIGIDWGVYGAPETFLVDADGIVIYKHIAPLTPEIWQQNFLPLINAQRGEQ